MNIPFRFPFYRWPDGSKAELFFSGRELMLSVEGGRCTILLSRGRPVSFLRDPKAQVFLEEIEDDDLGRKLRGVLLDLGVESYFTVPSGLIGTGEAMTPHVLHLPTFIDDGVWDSRYESALSTYLLEGGITGRVYNEQMINGSSFLGIFSGFLVQTEDSPELLPAWKIHWNGGSFDGETLEQALDAFFEKYPVLPESGRSRWEAENIEHGEFLFLTDEEIEIFQLLGERLPFFWDVEKAFVWLSERSSS